MRFRILFVSLIMSLMTTQFSGAINPDALTDDERTVLVRSCRDVQRQMQRIQYVDPVARVNRGNAYANIAKLMTAMGSRAAYNSYSVPVFVGATNTLQSLRQDFATQYTAYEIALRDLINFDCIEKPEEFYKRLIDVRAKRARVFTTINLINTQLDIFAGGMVDLQTQMAGKS